MFLLPIKFPVPVTLDTIMTQNKDYHLLYNKATDKYHDIIILQFQTQYPEENFLIDGLFNSI